MSEERVNSVPKKLLAARKHIKQSPIKREGSNDFSHYDYFTPDQVAMLVDDACQEVGLLTTFSLDKDENGHYGSLIIIDVENGDTLTSVMRTEMPEIKATNAAQQMGGLVTYTKRYMLMNEFDIVDNNLDFDSKDNRPSAKKEEADAAPKKLGLKKVHITKEEPAKEEKKAEEVAEPMEEHAVEAPVEVEEKSAEEERIEELRAMCDELGIKYTKRHKESGLTKLIEEHNSAQSSSVPFEGGEDVEDEEVPEEEESDEPELKDVYINSVNEYTSAETLFKEAQSIIKSADDAGLPEDDIEEIKLAINTKFKALKSA